MLDRRRSASSSRTRTLALRQNARQVARHRRLALRGHRAGKQDELRRLSRRGQQKRGPQRPERLGKLRLRLGQDIDVALRRGHRCHLLHARPLGLRNDRQRWHLHHRLDLLDVVQPRIQALQDERNHDAAQQEKYRRRQDDRRWRPHRGAYRRQRLVHHVHFQRIQARLHLGRLQPLLQSVIQRAVLFKLALQDRQLHQVVALLVCLGLSRVQLLLDLVLGRLGRQIGLLGLQLQPVLLGVDLLGQLADLRLQAPSPADGSAPAPAATAPSTAGSSPAPPPVARAAYSARQERCQASSRSTLRSYSGPCPRPSGSAIRR